MSYLLHKDTVVPCLPRRPLHSLSCRPRRTGGLMTVVPEAPGPCPPPPAPNLPSWTFLKPHTVRLTAAKQEEGRPSPYREVPTRRKRPPSGKGFIGVSSGLRRSFKPSSESEGKQHSSDTMATTLVPEGSHYGTDRTLGCSWLFSETWARASSEQRCQQGPSRSRPHHAGSWGDRGRGRQCEAGGQDE